MAAVSALFLAATGLLSAVIGSMVDRATSGSWSDGAHVEIEAGGRVGESACPVE